MEEYVISIVLSCVVQLCLYCGIVIICIGIVTVVFVVNLSVFFYEDGVDIYIIEVSLHYQLLEELAYILIKGLFLFFILPVVSLF